MRGTVHRRNKTWSYVVDVGVDPATGKRRQQHKGGFATKKAAELALAETVQRVGSGTHVGRDPQTVEEWTTSWLETVESKVRPATLRAYRQDLAHVSRHIGRMRLQSLTPLQVEQMYAEMLRDGKRYGGGLSPKSVRNIHAALRRSLADAERLGVVARNVAAVVRPPAIPRQEMTAWSAADVRRFLDFVADDRFAAAFRLIVSTGMRRGEVLGLTWPDVDLDRAQLSINKALTALDGKIHWSSPKTTRSRRLVALDRETVGALRAHRRRQAEERLAAGAAWNEQQMVFCREDGSPFMPDRFTRRFDALVRESGVPRIRLHDLRHTYATLALQAGINPKVVSDRLGHSTINITLDLYSHVMPSLDREAADIVAALFAADCPPV